MLSSKDIRIHIVQKNINLLSLFVVIKKTALNTVQTFCGGFFCLVVLPVDGAVGQ